MQQQNTVCVKLTTKWDLGSYEKLLVLAQDFNPGGGGGSSSPLHPEPRA